MACLISTASFGQSLDKARALSRNEQFDDAEAEFNSLIQFKPKVAEHYYYHALNLIHSGDTAEGLAEFQNLYKLLPKSPLSSVGMGYIKVYEGNIAEAKNFFAVGAKAKKKQRAFINQEIARSLLMIGPKTTKASYLEQAKLASDFIKASLAANTNFENTLLNGDILAIVNTANLIEALTQYKYAEQYDPKSPLPALNIAKVYLKIPGSAATVIDYAKAAIEKDSNFAPGYRVLGEGFEMDARERNKRSPMDSAIKYYKKYLVKNNNLSARKKYVEALFVTKNYDLAANEAKELYKIKPNYKSLPGIIFRSYAELRNTTQQQNAEGLSMLDVYVKTVYEPKGIGLSYYDKYCKAQLLTKDSQYDAAYALWKEVLSDTGKATTSWYNFAITPYANAFSKPNVCDYVYQFIDLKELKTKGKLSKNDHLAKFKCYNQQKNYNQALVFIDKAIVLDTTEAGKLDLEYRKLGIMHSIDNQDTITGANKVAYLKWIENAKKASGNNNAKIKNAYSRVIAYSQIGLRRESALKYKGSYNKAQIPQLEEIVSYYDELLKLDPTSVAYQTGKQNNVDLIDKLKNPKVTRTVRNPKDPKAADKAKDKVNEVSPIKK